MNQSDIDPTSNHSFALIGNHLPRKCGIAAFTTDLLAALAREAVGSDCWAVVMNDRLEGYAYSSKVRFEIDCNNLSDYRLAADFLNMNQVDAVCLQHEYGIYGGPSGAHIVKLLQSLRMPKVVTLHTVLAEPTSQQKTVLQEVAGVSDRVIVMSHRARQLLEDYYDIPPGRVCFIPHGIPDVPFVDPNYYKDQFGVEGRKVLLTFGLLSPGKGIEYVVEAMPRILREHPEVVYIVLGATHPHVKEIEGESYRLGLQLRAKELGVEDHLIFHNRFVSLQELCEFLGAADIYITPYLNEDQVVSGTLAYAMGTGKAVISTPYWYAKEMLDERRGRLVPFGDSNAIANEICGFLDHEVEQHSMRKRAYTFCREMIWEEVARRYLAVFEEVKNERQQRPRLVFHAKTLQNAPDELPQVNFDHLFRITDDVGILQHANFIVPNRFHGYCTDDNARALIVVMIALELTLGGHELMNLACRYLSFLDHAFNQEIHRFRNFMSYDRRWLEEQGSEDSHARALWGLGTAVGFSEKKGFTSVALGLFERALPVTVDFKSPRAWAFTLVGIHAYLRRFSGDSEVRRVRKTLAEKLFSSFPPDLTDDWPWFENVLSYANAKIPQALLMSGRWVPRGDMVELGLRSLDWLCKVQTDPKGHYVPIGNQEWYRRDAQRSRFDQQPIEAQNMIDACLEAYQITQDKKWLDEARRCFEWFLGRNDLRIPLCDYKTGGCCDGLTADGTNQNQGAESSLAWLISLLNMYRLNYDVPSKDEKLST